MSDFSMRMRQSNALPLADFFRGVTAGSRTLSICVAVFAVGFIVCSALPLIDDRLLLGVSVWEKPAKFFLSLGVHFATVAWALSLLDFGLRQSRDLRWAVRLMTGAAVLELIYIVVQAARDQASHFNTGTPLMAALYAIMGLGALTLTFTAGYVGFRIWRNRQGDLRREAAGFGLMLGAVLGTLTAGYMSSQTGHNVGGALSDVSGLPFFHWSTTGGDLRVAHFVGLHAMQVLPLVALGGKRGVVYGTAVVVTVLTGMTFVQALMGVPFLRG
jgi:hypothetical protein